MLEKIFKLSVHGTTVKKELLAGLITFLTMSYILMVNPIILGETGMDKAALFTSTALVAMIATLLMAFLANIPVAQAPGMGMNTFFASTVVMTMGYSWQFALTAVFIEGIIFILLTCFNIREILVRKIPQTLKNAIPAGIGLFIAFIGLQQAGIVVANPHTMVTLGDWTNNGIWVALFGLITIGALLARNIPGAILIGILSSTVLALVLGVTHLPEGAIVSVPPSIAPIFAQFEWTQVFSFDMLIVVFTFLMVNLFDTIGTLVGVASKAGLMDKKGNFPQVKKALFADALGTTIGSVMGNSVVTSYVESASGVAAGGRTGLTAVSTALMFMIALFLSPIFLIVPVQATAPALIIVGLFMLSSVLNINFSDYTESIPAYLTIIVMPFTYSIAEGIIFGILGFVFIKFLTGKVKDISIPIYLIALLFFIKIIIDVVIRV
ncbi:MAG: NCS2 family permease [Dysgonamonadaceae bacterium]|jgi:AGZA family xanthine/uracil permease-like MFS transporter|nr:NCS2 family permease [Dysgonamonadaceae bacterium]